MGGTSRRNVLAAIALKRTIAISRGDGNRDESKLASLTSRVSELTDGSRNQATKPCATGAHSPRWRPFRLDKLFQEWSDWQSVLATVQPETVMKWQRMASRLSWRWKSRKGKIGRPLQLVVTPIDRRKWRHDWTLLKSWLAVPETCACRLCDSRLTSTMQRGATGLLFGATWHREVCISDRSTTETTTQSLTPENRDQPLAVLIQTAVKLAPAKSATDDQSIEPHSK